MAKNTTTKVMSFAITVEVPVPYVSFILSGKSIHHMIQLAGNLEDTAETDGKKEDYRRYRDLFSKAADCNLKDFSHRWSPTDEYIVEYTFVFSNLNDLVKFASDCVV